MALDDRNDRSRSPSGDGHAPDARPAPGRVTLTSKLAPRPANDVQRRADPAASPGDSSTRDHGWNALFDVLAPAAAPVQRAPATIDVPPEWEESRATIDEDADRSGGGGPRRLRGARLERARRLNRHYHISLRFDPAIFGGGEPGSIEFAEAVAAFQAAHGLAVDGIVGAATRKAAGIRAPHERAADPHDERAAATIDVPPEYEESRATIQERAAGPRETDDDQTRAIAARGVAGGGGELPHLETLQARFGRHADALDGVRAHVGGDAAHAASSIGAHAYATGADIAFASTPDLHLAAHEAAHVVQQRAGVSLAGGVGAAGDPYEQHADRVADAVTRGASAEPILDEMAGGGVGSRTRGVQRFGYGEHRDLGNAATGGEKLDELEIDGKPITFGELVALAGDHFATVGDLRDLMKTPSGQKKIRWAIWWKGDGNKATEPDASETEKQSIRDQYLELASKNISHFAAGGTARETYSAGHRDALVKAFLAGAYESKKKKSEAITDEAFCQHYLSDAFAGGHVETPRQEMQTEYKEQFPGSNEQLIGFLAHRLRTELMAIIIQSSMGGWGGLMPNVVPDWVSGAPFPDVDEAVELVMRKVGGTAVSKLTLGGLVALAYHDYFNSHGLFVTSQVDAQGKKENGGHMWKAMGDGHLKDADNPDSQETTAMAVAAMKASRDELDRAYELGGDQRPPKDPDAHDAWAKGKVSTWFALPAALAYLPVRDDSSDYGRNADLDWHWGDMNPVMVEAMNATISGTVFEELSAARPDFPLVGQAWDRVCADLDARGIAAIEDAMGSTAAPEPEAPPLPPDVDAGAPMPAGVD